MSGADEESKSDMASAPGSGKDPLLETTSRSRRDSSKTPGSPQSPATTSSEGRKEGTLKPRTAIGLLVLIFLVSSLGLLLVYYSFPELEADEVDQLKFPRDIEEAKQLGILLSRYKDRYFPQVLGGVFVTYLFLQTFAIPGSIFLSIVSGFLFPFPVALLLICFCSATGASFCYLLSYLVGRQLVNKYIPERSAKWAETVNEHRGNLLSYITFLRITPFLPNWFINIVSPVIGVDLKPFWLGTFIGVAPPSFVAIQAGTTLQEMTSTSDAITVQSVVLLVVFALLSVLPVIFKDRHSIAAFFTRKYQYFATIGQSSQPSLAAGEGSEETFSPMSEQQSEAETPASPMPSSSDTNDSKDRSVDVAKQAE